MEPSRSHVKMYSVFSSLRNCGSGYGTIELLWSVDDRGVYTRPHKIYGQVGIAYGIGEYNLLKLITL